MLKVVLPSLGWSSSFAVTFLLDRYCWVPVGEELGQTVFVVLGNHLRLPPVDLPQPQNPRRDSVCCQQVVRVVCCCFCAVDPRFQLVFWIGFWDLVDAGDTVYIVAAFFVIVGVLVVALSRVVPLFAVRVVAFGVGSDIDARARGLRSCATCTYLSLSV